MGKILTRHGEIQQLAKLFKKSRVTVRDALSDKTKSDLSRRIRKVAMDRGAMEILDEETLKININENNQTSTDGMEPLAAG